MQVYTYSSMHYKAEAEVNNSLGLSLASLLDVYSNHTLDLYGSLPESDE